MRTMATLFDWWALKNETSFPSLIPDVDFITFNNEDDLQKITTKQLFLETIQDSFNRRMIF
jgi:acetylornithine/succinyldiaminopimelate/putrescine aminotransferase